MDSLSSAVSQLGSGVATNMYTAPVGFGITKVENGFIVNNHANYHKQFVFSSKADALAFIEAGLV